MADWQSDEAIWRAAVRTSPQLIRPRINYATAVMRLDPEAAIQPWQDAARVLRADPSQGPDLKPLIGAHLLASAQSVDPLVTRQTLDIARWAGCRLETGWHWICGGRSIPSPPTY